MILLFAAALASSPDAGEAVGGAAVAPAVAVPPVRKPPDHAARPPPPAVPFALPDLGLEEAPLTDDPEGPRIVFAPRRAAPIVVVRLTIDTEGLIDTGRVTQGAVAALDRTWAGPWSAGPRAAIARRGGWSSVDCGWETCTLALQAPTEALAPALDAFSDLLRTPALTEQGLQKWRRDRADDHRGAHESGNSAHAWAKARLFWPGGKQVVAPDARYRAVTLRQLEETWHRVVTEGRVEFAVTGDTTLATVAPLLRERFGDLRGTVRRPAERGPDLDEARVVVVDVPWMTRQFVTVAWDSPGYLEEGQPGWQIAWQALAVNLGTRVMQKVRETDGFVYSMGGNYYEVTAQDGWSWMEFVVDADDLGGALVGIEGELARLQREGLAPEELRGAVEGQIGFEALGMASSFGLARLLRTYADLPTAHFATRVPAYRDVTLAQVNAAAQTWLARPRTWLVTGNRKAIDPVLTEQKWTVTTHWTACTAVRGRKCR